MDRLDWQVPLAVLVPYLAYSVFLFYNTLHVHKFKGASMGFQLYLNTHTLIARLASYGFIFYWGWKVSWLQAGLLFLASLIITLLFTMLEARMAKGSQEIALWMSLAGLIAIPILSYLLFTADTR